MLFMHDSNTDLEAAFARASAELMRHPPPRPGQADYLQAFARDDPVAKNARYRSCAVVGSSGHLLAAARGAEIDAHEAVFRFNTAPVRGFERHVGRRTTLRVLNSRTVFFQ